VNQNHLKSDLTLHKKRRLGIVLSDCGNISKVVDPLLLVRFDPVSEIKQAIREVLLSDEFLTAFAAAWQKTPLIYNEELNTRPTYTNGEIA